MLCNCFIHQLSLIRTTLSSLIISCMLEWMHYTISYLYFYCSIKGECQTDYILIICPCYEQRYMKDAYDFISHTWLQIVRFLYMIRIIIHHHPPPCFYLPLHLLPSLPLLPMHAEMVVQRFNLIRESRTSNMVSI